MKYINFKRYKFSTVIKDFKSLIGKIFKFTDFRRYSPQSISSYIDIRRLYYIFSFRKLYNYLRPKKYIFNKIGKKFKSDKLKKFYFYFVSIILFSFISYLSTPTFYKYEKNRIENAICKSENLKCLVESGIQYGFYPTPRIKIKKLIIYNNLLKKEFIIVNNAEIKISLKNLINKNKQIYKKVIFHNFKINFDLKNLSSYQKIFKEENNLIPIKFKKGQIILLDKDNEIVKINNVSLNSSLNENLKKIKIKGQFLNDNLSIIINSKKIDNKPSTNFIMKMSDLNLLTKINLFNHDKNLQAVSGDILIKKDKQKFTGLFNYSNHQVSITKSNLRNNFLDGKLKGDVTFLPYFTFNLDLALNSINFTKLYSYFLSLDEKDQKRILSINKKINGNLNLSSDRIYSSYNLVKSFESRLKFNNGNIILEQFLINLGKLGAADLLGEIRNDKKFNNFKYESNIFIDNQKKFLSKFGIYNRDSISSNLFISGNFDLRNIRASFYEIFENKKLNDEDINFIEQEFNDYMLSDGYKNLFRFPKFKEFIKSVTSKEN